MLEHHRPRKRFGQHFLTDRTIADRIATAAFPKNDAAVLEIGPGTGKLTERLLEKAVDVWAVEIDRDLVRSLRARFAGNPRFHLVESDILAFDPHALPVDGRIRVASNIPYNITTPIIEYLVRYRDVISGGVLMMQRETAARLLAGPGSREYGLTSLNFALYGRGRKLFDVKPGSFSPPPGVVSRVVELEIDEHCRYQLHSERVYRLITGAVFRQRRKMIRNSFIPYLGRWNVSAERAVEILEDTGISPSVRPETISVDAYVALANRCNGLILPESRRERES